MLSDDVTDSTDFPSSHQYLRNIDEAFRCPICKDIIKAPVVLSACGHSFCSQCLRESLNLNEQCPQCRIKTHSGHIVKNSALEGAVLAYAGARQALLQLVTVPEPPRREQLKRKRSVLTDTDMKDVDPSPSHISSLEGAGPNQRTRRGTTSNVNVEMVECPQCNALVDFEDINSHLDRSCASIPSTSSKQTSQTKDKKAWQDLFDGLNTKKPGESKRNTPPQRLVKEAYDTLKDRQLRERLQRFELSTVGTRAKLQARHERWVVIYNANMDQAPDQQKSTNALKAQLAAWEAGRERDEREKFRAQDSVSSSEAYEVVHRSQFESLVKQANPLKPPQGGNR